MYFILPDKIYPGRPLQIWTQGQAEDTRYYLPVYDYPNDRTTTEVILTVPGEWTTLSNGRLVSTTPAAGGQKRWHWKQEQPHSTYLITIVAGEFDERAEAWRGTALRYVVPRGRSARIEPTFRHTQAMLEFFQEKVGVAYPWPQYAQAAVDEFTYGGMENTSATTIGAAYLVNPLLEKESAMNQDDLIAHEAAHQWFGDLVTCKDWGELWLNEGFATYFEVLWREKQYGRDAAELKLWQDRAQWMGSQRLYTVPLVARGFTNYLQIAGNVYAKAGQILHMLRAELGEEDFWASLRLYVEKHRYQNVVTADLVKAIEEATGRNVDQFFDQWVYGAGAPRLEVSAEYEEAGKRVKLTVKQTQKVEGRVGLFRVPVEVEVWSGGKAKSHVIVVSTAEETFEIASEGKPELVLFNKGGRILAAVQYKKDAAEWIFQLARAEHAFDRLEAAQALGGVTENAEVVSALGRAAVGDKFWGVKQQAITALRRIGGPAAEAGVLAALGNAEPWVRSSAMNATGFFHGSAAAREAAMRTFREDKAWTVRAQAVTAVARLEGGAAYDFLVSAAGMESPDNRIRIAALRAFGTLGDARAVALVREWSEPGKPVEVRLAAIATLATLARDHQGVTQQLATYLEEPSRVIVTTTAFALGNRGDVAAVGALEKAAARTDLNNDARQLVMTQLGRLRRAAKEEGAVGAGRSGVEEDAEVAEVVGGGAGDDVWGLCSLFFERTNDSTDVNLAVGE